MVSKIKLAYKYLMALWDDINDKRILGTAVNLTYSTLLAFVP